MSNAEIGPKAEVQLSVEDIEAAAARTTVYFAEGALRHGFIEAITTPTMPMSDVANTLRDCTTDRCDKARI